MQRDLPLAVLIWVALAPILVHLAAAQGQSTPQAALAGVMDAVVARRVAELVKDRAAAEAVLSKLARKAQALARQPQRQLPGFITAQALDYVDLSAVPKKVGSPLSFLPKGARWVHAGEAPSTELAHNLPASSLRAAPCLSASVLHWRLGGWEKQQALQLPERARCATAPCSAVHHACLAWST